MNLLLSQENNSLRFILKYIVLYEEKIKMPLLEQIYFHIWVFLKKDIKSKMRITSKEIPMCPSQHHNNNIFLNTSQKSRTVVNEFIKVLKEIILAILLKWWCQYCYKVMLFQRNDSKLNTDKYFIHCVPISTVSFQITLHAKKYPIFKNFWLCNHKYFDFCF